MLFTCYSLPFFPEKVASQNSAQRKDNKVGNKTGCKKGWQKEKKECEERTLKTDSSPPPKKKTNFVSKCSKDKKSCLITSSWPKNLLKLSVKNFLFSHSHVNQPKTAPKKEDLVKNAAFCYQNDRTLFFFYKNVFFSGPGWIFLFFCRF